MLKTWEHRTVYAVQNVKVLCVLGHISGRLENMVLAGVVTLRFMRRTLKLEILRWEDQKNKGGFYEKRRVRNFKTDIERFRKKVSTL